MSVLVSVGVLGAPMSFHFLGSGRCGGTVASFASIRTRSVRVPWFPVLLPFPQFFSLLSMAWASATPNTSAVTRQEIRRISPRVLSESCGMLVPAGSALAFHSSHNTFLISSKHLFFLASVLRKASTAGATIVSYWILVLNSSLFKPRYVHASAKSHFRIYPHNLHFNPDYPVNARNSN